MLCKLVFQPVIQLIQIVVAAIEYILVQICRLIEVIVTTVIEVLKWVCNTVVHTVCNAVCSLVCGICDFFCGIFGCDCGCENVCNNVCGTVTEVLCGWTKVTQVILEYATRLVCTYLVKAILVLLHLFVTIVTMVLTWVCTLIDWLIRWFLCWTYLAELADLFTRTRARRFKVAPKVIANSSGYSDWFVYVNNPTAAGNVDQSAKVYVLSDRGAPLLPIIDRSSRVITYVEVATKGDTITGELRRDGDDLVPGRPFLYYPHKIMEIASHLFGDTFANDPADDGTGTDPRKNLFTYDAAVQARLAGTNTLARNNYNAWPSKFTNPAAGDFFGDGSLADFGLRVDTDATCSRPTNTFLHLVDQIRFTSGNTAIAEQMTCGAGQTLTFEETNFLMVNKNPDACAVTTYFVSSYAQDESSVGCNDLLGYTIVTPATFADRAVLPFTANTVEMMARIVDNISGHRSEIVRVAETYLHECGHQSGLIHDTDAPDCEKDATLHIAKLLSPGGEVRRALTRWQWCMLRTSCYCTLAQLEPFLKAPELAER